MATRIEIAEQKQITALRDLERAGGIVAKGTWSTGTGNYKKAREVPIGASSIGRTNIVMPAEVSAWFAAHTRAERCVYLDHRGRQILAAYDQRQRDERAKAWAAA